MSESDLNKHGLEIDPSDPNVIVAQDPEKIAQPDDSWDIDRLGRYATARIADATRLEKEALHLARRSTVEVYRAGQALLIVRNRLKCEGTWCEWQKQHKIPRTTAWEAIQLFQRATSEEAVANLTRSEAKAKYGLASIQERKVAVPSGDVSQIPGEEQQLIAFSSDEDEYPASCNQNDFECDSPESPEGDAAALLLAGLVRIADWLEYHKDKVQRIDWEVDSPADYLRVLETVDEFLWQIKEEVPGSD